jgi:hypothetical protein
MNEIQRREAEKRRVSFSDPLFLCVNHRGDTMRRAHQRMNENGTQIGMIDMIFSFSLRPLRPLRFIYTEIEPMNRRGRRDE